MAVLSGGGGLACDWFRSALPGAETTLSQRRRRSENRKPGGLDGERGTAGRGVMKWCHEPALAVLRWEPSSMRVGGSAPPDALAKGLRGGGTTGSTSTTRRRWLERLHQAIAQSLADGVVQGVDGALRLRVDVSFHAQLALKPILSPRSWPRNKLWLSIEHE